MKNVLLLTFLVLGFGLQAQDVGNINSASKGKLLKLSPKMMNTLNKFSVTASMGTPSFSTKEIGNLNFKKLSNVSISELNLAYKVNNRISIGIGMVGNLGNCNSGYTTAEGTFMPFHSDDDDDDDHDDDDDDDDYDDDECDDDELGNLMGNITYKLSDKFPLFIQASGGYAFGSNAPAYSAMIGYNQKIFAGIGIIAGIRYSDVLYKKPVDAISVTPSHGLKAEIGLSWNF